jgi:hypothetical protein
MANLQATTVNGTLNALKTENNTTASRALALTDRDRVVACTNTSAITITVPADASVNFPIGSVVHIARSGTAAVTLAAAGGVTVTAVGALGPNEEIMLRKRAANNWLVVERPYPLSGTGGTVATTGNFTSHRFNSGTATFTVVQ